MKTLSVITKILLILFFIVGIGTITWMAADTIKKSNSYNNGYEAGLKMGYDSAMKQRIHVIIDK